MTLRYTKEELIGLNVNKLNEQKPQWIPENAHSLIKNFNLQRHRRGCRAGKRKCKGKESVTPQEPIVGITKPDNRRKRAKFGLINIRSIKNNTSVK